MGPESGIFQPEPVPPIIPLEVGEAVLPNTTPPPERGSMRWNMRRILGRGAVGAVTVPILALVLTAVLGRVEITPQTIIKDMAFLGWQAFFGGAIGAFSEVRRQQNQRKILASS